MDSFTKLKNYFKNPNLLTHALTHRSWINEHRDGSRSNERLEFLGDAILEFIVTEVLFENYTDKEEGYLTALRARIVNTVNLAQVALKLNLGKELLLSKGEEDTGGRNNQSLLADTLEAVIGAIYLDGGLQLCKKFVTSNLLVNLSEMAKESLKDSKSLFQEIIQSKGFTTPKYQVIHESGPDHNKTFVLEVVVDGKVMGKGTGKSKSEAAQSAAKDALEKFL